MNTNQLLSLVGRTTQEECREMGLLLLELADRPRDANWSAMVRQAEGVIGLPGSENPANVIAERRKRFAKWHDMLVASGLDHRTLIANELQVRGDERSVAELEKDLDGWLESNVLHSHLRRSRRPHDACA